MGCRIKWNKTGKKWMAALQQRPIFTVGLQKYQDMQINRDDCVVVLERPDELVKEFALGRMTDSATGQTYHPIYAPPPAEVQGRLVWRLDDTPLVVERRCADFRQSVSRKFPASGFRLPGQS